MTMPNEEFEKWWQSCKWKSMTLDSWGAILLAQDAFNARQPEIDALNMALITEQTHNLELQKENAALKAETTNLHNKLLDEILSRQELSAEVEKLRAENVDLSVMVDALTDLVDSPFANTVENRKLVRELWEETK